MKYQETKNIIAGSTYRPDFFNDFIIRYEKKMNTATDGIDRQQGNVCRGKNKTGNNEVVNVKNVIAAKDMFFRKLLAVRTNSAKRVKEKNKIVGFKQNLKAPTNSFVREKSVNKK